MQEYEFRNQRLQLLPEKAIYFPEHETLWIADLHFGKVGHFRKSGIAVPQKAGQQNLLRLQNLLERYAPQEVIFLGDLFHSEINAEWSVLEGLLSNFPGMGFRLIKGNHDILPKASYRKMQIHNETLLWNDFVLSHEPLARSEHYNFCGHIHPGVKMRGLGRQSLKLPCFYFGERQAILPAFGEFTGLAPIQPKKGDTLFVIADGKVLPV